MTDFDKMVKDMAKQEPLDLPEKYNSRIEHLLHSLENRKNNAAKKPYRSLPLSAALFCLCFFIFGGVAYGINKISSYVYNWDGALVDTISQTGPNGTAGKQIGNSPAEPADEKQFMDTQPDGELRQIVFTQNEYFTAYTQGMTKEIDSIEQLQSFLQDAQHDLFLLPEHIPEGYETGRILLSFYLSPDITHGALIPAKVEYSSRGNMMQTFILPDGYKNYIESYQITYENPNGGVLDIMVRLDGSGEHLFNLSENGNIETLSLQGLDKAIYYEDIHEDSEGMISTKSIHAAKTIKDYGIGLYSSGMFSYSDGQSETKPKKPKQAQYHNLTYSIDFTNDTSISITEMLNILESLQ